MIQEGKKSWDATWEKIFSERPWGKYPGESLIRFVAQNFYNRNRNRKEIKILEVGFGTGANIWYLAKENFSVFGIEGSETGIRIARQRLREEGLEAELVSGDIVQLPYSDNFFDAVIDCECIYCNDLTNTKIIFGEINRVLQPGGKFYSRTFSTDQFIGKEYETVAENEYTNISTGPLANKGFARLTPQNAVPAIYGSHFNIISVDTLNATIENGAVKISELIIVLEKK
jgi:ubiquinone/menaquinone biosynthesis C-methylase UbiE